VDFSNESRNLQIADYLQTLRLEQNLTLEQLSHLSQVPIVHLTSIEEGRFARFDEFYLKMYLKRYTQALDVDLEQLYTYATQQPLPETSADTKKNENKRQMTQTQADISAAVKHVNTKKPKRKKSTIKSVSVARIEARNRIGKFIVGLVLVALLIVFVIFFVTLIRDLPRNDASYQETIPPVENPHDITGPDEDETETATEASTEPEEPSAEDLTSITFNDHSGEVHTFDLITAQDELNLRIEHSDRNWIDITNGIYEDTFEYSFELDDQIRFRVGAVQNIEAIFINDVEVEFETDQIGAQTFIFNIETQ